MAATVQYARNGDVHLAYQVIGDGSHDVLLLAGGTMPMDALDQHPKGLEVLFGLQRLGRLIVTDQRGVGQSDRTESGFTPENEADDLAAVLVAADAHDCLLVACFDASLAALALAARDADRLGSLVIVNGFAQFSPSFGDLEQLPPDAIETFHEILDGGGADTDFSGPRSAERTRRRSFPSVVRRSGTSRCEPYDGVPALEQS